MFCNLRFVFYLAFLLYFVHSSNHHLENNRGIDEVKAHDGLDSEKKFTTAEEILALVNKATYTVSKMVEMSKEASRTAAEMQDLITALTMKANKLLVEQPISEKKDSTGPHTTQKSPVQSSSIITTESESLSIPDKTEAVATKPPPTKEDSTEPPTTQESPVKSTSTITTESEGLPIPDKTEEVSTKPPKPKEDSTEPPTTQESPVQSTAESESLPIPDKTEEDSTEPPTTQESTEEYIPEQRSPTGDFVYTTNETYTEVPTVTDPYIEDPEGGDDSDLIDTEFSMIGCYNSRHWHGGLSNACAQTLYNIYHIEVKGYNRNWNWKKCSEFENRYNQHTQRNCGYWQAKCTRHVKKKKGGNANWFCCASVRCHGRKRLGMSMG